MADSRDHSNVLGVLSHDDKLEGSNNYPLWSFMVRNLLVAKDLWDLVFGDFPRPGGALQQSPSRRRQERESTPTSSTIEGGTTARQTIATQEQRRWDSRDAQAVALIALSVKKSVIPHIRSCRTSKVAWDTLEDLFQTRNAARISFLKREILNLRMEEGQSMQEHLTKIQDIREQLINIDEVISDSELVNITLNSLPESYMTFYSSLMLSMRSSADSLSFMELQGLLLQEEQTRKNMMSRNNLEVAMFSKGKGKYKPKNQNQSKQSNDSQGKGSNKKSGVCYYCKKPGHYIGECRKRIAKENKDASINSVSDDTKDENASENISASFVEEDYAFLTISDINDNENFSFNSSHSDVWYFDSGASKHITSKRSLFTELKPTSFEKKVTCANDQSHFIKGVGSISICAVDGTEFTLSNILYVPGITKNLLSISAFSKCGYHIIFDDNRCIVRDREKENKVVLTGTLIKGLYVLDNYERKAHIMVVSEITIAMKNAQLWHARFGHINFRSLLNLQNQRMVDSLPELETPPTTCEGCILGKMHRTPFKKDSVVRANKSLQLIHSDVCGPMRTESLSGYTYFVTFIDDFSRFTWIYGLKSKADVFICFKSLVSRLENETGNKVQTLRTDRGGEYISKVFSEFLNENGIKHEYTIRFTPQQNRVTERRNRTLMEMTRCMLSSMHLPHKFWFDGIQCSNHILNRAPTKALKTMTPYEAYYGKKPNVHYFRVFGSVAYVHVPRECRGKLDDKAIRCIFIGYSSESKGYRCYDPKSKKVIISRDVVFMENKSFSQEEF